MKRYDNDILKDPKLREMPFTVPEGYFSDFKENVSAYKGYSRSSRPDRRYIAIAASFTLLLGVGFGAARWFTDTEEYSEIDLMVLSDVSAENYYDLLSYQEGELTDEDIIDYLIDSGQDIDNIEPNE